MKLVYFALLLLCFMLHRYSQNNGIGITYDSLNYLHAAKTWSEQQKFINQNQTKYIQQPPLFPLILTLFDTKKSIYISYFFTFCLIISVSIYFWWIDFIFTDTFTKIVCALCVSVGTPWYLVHHFLWSEPVFLVLFNVSLVSFYQIIANKSFQKYHYFLLFLANFLLCLQRNTGIFFVFGEVIFVILIHRKKIIAHLFLLFVLFSSSLGWFFWTYFSIETIGSSEKFIGIYMHSGWYEKLKGVDFLHQIFWLWVFPVNIFWLRILMSILVGIFLSIFIIQNKIKIPLSLCIMFFLSAFYMLILSTFPLVFSDVERYLSVIFPIFLLFLFYFYEIIIIKYPKIKILLMCFFLLLSSYQSIRTIKNVIFWQKYKGDLK